MPLTFDRIMDYVLTTLETNPNFRAIIEKEKKSLPDVYKHSLNVSKYAITISQVYNFDLDTIIKIGVGALLHYIGKLDTDMSILYKPDRLTTNEFTIIKAHSTYGYNNLREYTNDKVILDIVLNHHEKMDGLGYPFGKRDSEIPIYTQIVSIADIYDALISPRVYKEPISQQEAFKILESDKGLNKIAVKILKDSI